MLLTASDPDIQTIIGRIHDKDLDLQPNFQRGEVWPLSKKKKLVDSILRNWHVPPIHTVVIPSTGKQEVLDGQQRLAAIRDFVENKFRVDGSIAPHDPEIKTLDGLYYRKLPEPVRRRFNSFQIRFLRITEYKPEEPGELFFRLNQITNITSAEQRNAFYGPVRDQIKALVKIFEDRGNNRETLGFSNSRMAYDDVLAKLLCALEDGRITAKLTASALANRFREDKAINDQIIRTAEIIIEMFSIIRKAKRSPTKFNKATLLSWFIFIAHFVVRQKEEKAVRYLCSFLDSFEAERFNPHLIEHLHSDIAFHFSLAVPNEPSVRSLLLSIYNDRSTSRVLDVTSIVYRDLILSAFWWFYTEKSEEIFPFNRDRVLTLENFLSRLTETAAEYDLSAMLPIDLTRWGDI